MKISRGATTKVALSAALLGGLLLAAPMAAQATPSLPATGDEAPASGSPPEVVLTAAVANTAAAAPTLQKYTVVTGDTLWSIGIRFLRSESAWSRIASYNRISNPDLIYVGNVLTMPPASYTGSVSLPAPAPTYTPPPPVKHYSPPAPVRTYTPPPAPRVSSYVAPGSFKACVEMRESTNGRGSSNLYGILDSTWHSLGRSGSAWSASPAEQSAAFDQLYAKDGTSPWAPYDGC